MFESRLPCKLHWDLHCSTIASNVLSDTIYGLWGPAIRKICFVCSSVAWYRVHVSVMQHVPSSLVKSHSKRLGTSLTLEGPSTDRWTVVVKGSFSQCAINLGFRQGSSAVRGPAFVHPHGWFLFHCRSVLLFYLLVMWFKIANTIIQFSPSSGAWCPDIDRRFFLHLATVL